MLINRHCSEFKMVAVTCIKEITETISYGIYLLISMVCIHILYHIVLLHQALTLVYYTIMLTRNTIALPTEITDCISIEFDRVKAHSLTITSTVPFLLDTRHNRLFYRQGIVIRILHQFVHCVFLLLLSLETAL